MARGVHPGGQTVERACVDASFVLHLLLPDERDERVVSIWRNWSANGVQVVSPALLYAEVTSVIRLRVATGRITAEEGEQPFAAFDRLGIVRLDRDDLHRQAWQLARQHNTRRAYDMFYLALAQLEDIDMWTGDERFVNTVGQAEPRIRWISATETHQL